MAPALSISVIVFSLLQIMVSLAFSSTTRTSFGPMSRIDPKISRPVQAGKPVVMKMGVKGIICAPFGTIYKRIRDSISSRRLPRFHADTISEMAEVQDDGLFARSSESLNLPTYFGSSMKAIRDERIFNIGNTFALGESPGELAALSHYANEGALASLYIANIDGQKSQVLVETPRCGGVTSPRKLYDSRQKSPRR